MDEQLLRRGRPGLRGEGKKNLTSRKGVRWSQKDFNIGWFVCLLEILANSWQGFLLGSQITQRWESNGQSRSWWVHLPDNTQGGLLIAGYIHIFLPCPSVQSCCLQNVWALINPPACFSSAEQWVLERLVLTPGLKRQGFWRLLFKCLLPCFCFSPGQWDLL